MGAVESDVGVLVGASGVLDDRLHGGDWNGGAEVQVS